MVISTHQTELTREQKRMIEECYMMGRLAEDGPNLKLGIDYGMAVSLAKMEGPPKVVFYLEPMSKDPDLLRTKLGKKQEEVYISFDDKNKRYLERIGYFEKKEEEKVDFLKNHFKGKRVLFKPVLSPDRLSGGYYYNFEILLVERIENSEVEKKSYVPIPVISTSITSGRFERKLIDQKPIELNCYNHAHDIPEFIICGGYIYHIPDESVLEKYQINDHIYICKNPKRIKRIPFPGSFEHTMRMMHKEIAFTSEDDRMNWIDLVEEQGVAITEIDKEEAQKSIGKKVNMEVLNNQEAEKTAVVAENDFIHRLDFLAKIKKLRYSPEDLYNFHTSLKTSNFTILGGMSGTGKTQLAMLYAEALKMTEGDNLLFIPVQPSYTEPSDIFGFLNQQTGVFTESELGLVSFLYKASQNEKKMHMILFDEMNLGQVEHYFSDFISVLELDGDKKRLRLFNEGANCVQSHLKNGIPILDNILFVGTANFDETTRDFSNRMLDRSNVIILEKLSFVEAVKYENEGIENINDYMNQEKNEIKNPEQEITRDNFHAWIKGSNSLSYLEEHELSILDKLHEEISNFDSQTGVSFRIAKQIGHYLVNIPQDESGNAYLSRTTAFDYQIKQRILSKIRGHREQVQSLVGRYEDDYIDGRISIILSDNENEKYVKSIQCLKQKAKELKRNGYTL